MGIRKHLLIAASLLLAGLVCILAIACLMAPIKEQKGIFPNNPQPQYGIVIEKSIKFSESDFLRKESHTSSLLAQLDNVHNFPHDMQAPKVHQDGSSFSKTSSRNKPNFYSKVQTSSSALIAERRDKAHLSILAIKNANSGYSVAEEVVSVPTGVAIPAALAETNAHSSLDHTAQQEVQTIADNFFQEVDAETQSGVSPELAWTKQQQIADDFFRARYGWEVFNKESARANQQAKGH